MKRNGSSRSGQAMLIAVLSLGGAIMGATAIAGLLMLYQIRAATDSANSAKAIFAADAGVEWARFDYFCALEKPSRCPGVTPGVNDAASSTLSSADGAVYTVVCMAGGGTSTVCSDSTNTVQAISTGQAGGSRRAFLLTF